jgi:hypothetical protein
MKTIPAIVLCAITAHASAQSCGSTLTRDTTLSSDLSCPGFAHALRIDTPGITLDLAGYTISGSQTGVLVENAANVTIAGPGVIKGRSCYWNHYFDTAGVRAVDADQLSVSQVAFGGVPIAVSLEGVNGARIYDNVVGAASFGFVLMDAPSRARSARNNEISSNTMVGTAACGLVGAWLEGPQTHQNSLFKNDYSAVSEGIFVAASDNHIIGNHHSGRGGAIGYGVHVAAGNRNQIIGNRIRKVAIGVYLWPYHYDSRTGAAVMDAHENMVIANAIEASDVGIAVGALGVQTGGSALLNRIGDNQVRGASIGLYFGVNAIKNDGRGNGYLGVGTAVVDYGVANTWP